MTFSLTPTHKRILTLANMGKHTPWIAKKMGIVESEVIRLLKEAREFSLTNRGPLEGVA